MAKKMKGIKVICLLLLLALVAIAAPVSAVTLTVTLNKTYQFQGADLSTVNVIDLGNPAQSQVGILTTAGAGSDVQMIQAPQITSLERNFTQMSGSSNGNILTIIGNQDSTIPFQSTNYPIYIQPEIPTIGVTVPGQSGNPVVLKYTPGSASGNGLDSLLSSVDARFLYKNGGILYENSSGYFAEPATGPNQWVFNTTNLPVVLNLNSVNLNGFTALSSQSQLLGTFYPEFKGSTGKYYAGALTFDNELTNRYDRCPLPGRFPERTDANRLGRFVRVTQPPDNLRKGPGWECYPFVWQFNSYRPCKYHVYVYQFHNLVFADPDHRYPAACPVGVG